MKKNTYQGFTLIELLITVALFVIVITIAVGGFTNAIRTERQVSSLISAQSNVSLALEQMSRDIRTGYLFCHDPNVATPSSTCNDSDPTDPVGNTCTVDDSSGSPVWTCPTLDFYDAESNHINYSWAGGQLVESVNGGQPLSITGNTITIKYLQFRLFGQTEGDTWSPRITISIGVSPSSSDPGVANDVINLQTTVSSRDFDGLGLIGSSGGGTASSPGGGPGGGSAGGGSGGSTPPSVPTGLAVTAVSASTVSLSWDPSTDDGGTGVAGYDIYQGGTQVGTAAGTTFTDSGLSASTPYSYTVSAYDGSGNDSTQSSPVITTTAASSGNTTPPSAPGNLQANAASTIEIDLSWSPSSDSDGVIEGYQISRDGSQLTMAQGTSYQDTTLQPGTTHTYTVEAYDNNGNYSAPSSVTAATQSNGGSGGSGGSGAVTVGVIRWDAWVGSADPDGTYAEQAISPSEFQYRVPFYGTINSDSSVTVVATSQSVIDQEIQDAASAGINYFAYDYYPGSPLETALNLYMSSGYKSEIKFSLILGVSSWDPETVVNYFEDPQYVKVLGDRPLVYVYGGYGEGPQDQVQTLIADSEAAGAGDPYVVNMQGDLTADADGAYAAWGDGGSSDGEPFANLAASAEDTWEGYSEGVPLVTTGWDCRPYYLTGGPPWGPNPDDGCANYFQEATPTEIANELSSAISYVQANPSRFQANTVLIYAWNEIDEGGWLLPLLPQNGGSARLDAVGQVISSEQ